MSNAIVCFDCGEDVLETAPGPFGFVQVCRTCGTSTNLDDLMEPIVHEGVGRRLTPLAA